MLFLSARSYLRYHCHRIWPKDTYYPKVTTGGRRRPTHHLNLDAGVPGQRDLYYSTNNPTPGLARNAILSV